MCGGCLLCVWPPRRRRLTSPLRRAERPGDLFWREHLETPYTPIGTGWPVFLRSQGAPRVNFDGLIQQRIGITPRAITPHRDRTSSARSGHFNPLVVRRHLVLLGLASIIVTP